MLFLSSVYKEIDTFLRNNMLGQATLLNIQAVMLPIAHIVWL